MQETPLKVTIISSSELPSDDKCACVLFHPPVSSVLAMDHSITEIAWVDWLHFRSTQMCREQHYIRKACVGEAVVLYILTTHPCKLS